MYMETLFDISVLKEVEEDVSSQKEIEGKTVTVIEKVRKLKPIKLGLLKPGRRVAEGAEIFYAKTIAGYMKEGLLSLHMLAKRYDNDGGPFNDTESKVITSLNEQKNTAVKKYWETSSKTVKTEEDTVSENDALRVITRVQRDIDAIQNPYINIYNQTAEFKARNKAVNWWLIHLSLIEDSTGKMVRLFPGKDIFKDEDLEVQLDKSAEISEGKDLAMREAIRKLTYFVSCWAGGAVFKAVDDKPESVAAAEKVMKSALENYDLEFPDYPFRESLTNNESPTAV